MIITLASRFQDPSQNLKPLYQSWLARKSSEDKQLERYVRVILANFQKQKLPEPGGKPFIHWPPCLGEIEAIDKNKNFQI